MTETAPPSLRLLDLSLPTPEENLALDEALLIEVEARLAAGEPPARCEVLRIWESPVCFVTLGVSCRLTEDVDEPACLREGVPILRRASGGGTVLQGPGCLNFALVLSLAARPELRDVTRSYAEILGRIGRALGGEDAKLEGTSDLTAGGHKFSGNAQKRSRHAVLHHGTVLYAANLRRMSLLLREPPRQPAYRARRAHEAFVGNLPLPAVEIKARLERAWNARRLAPEPALPDLEALLERQRDPAWVRRF